jgi:hypothetical protein
MVVFAQHNVLADPPFTRLDVVACRNLLIYLDPNAQQQLLTLFHYALRPGGLLFLGSSETVGNLGNLFSTQNRQWKILVGQPIKTLIPPEYHQQTDDLLERCRRGDNLRQVESFRLTKSGEVLPTLLTVSPLSNDKGDITGIATIAQHPSGAPNAQRLS